MIESSSRAGRYATHDELLERIKVLEARCISLVWSLPGETMAGDLHKKAERVLTAEQNCRDLKMMMNRLLFALNTSTGALREDAYVQSVCTDVRELLARIA